MKNILKYLVNTNLFIVISFIPATLFILWSFSINGYRPSGLIAIGGIISLFISYTIVKRINKSVLWLSVFDEEKLSKNIESEFQSSKKEEKKIDVVIEQTKTKVEEADLDIKQKNNSFDILIARIFKIIAISIFFFGSVFFIACKTFIPSYCFNQLDYEKANQFWMIFSSTNYPGTENYLLTCNEILINSYLEKYRCNEKVKKGRKCTIHENVEIHPTGKYIQCRKRKADGSRCKMQTNSKSGYCYYHD